VEFDREQGEGLFNFFSFFSGELSFYFNGEFTVVFGKFNSFLGVLS
jgi:hypothetical protein